jgi:hypothetical protein
MRRVRLNESQLRMVIRKIVNEQAHTPSNKIVAAYESTAIDELDDDGTPMVVYVWKYADGTGNAQRQGTRAPFFTKGVKFEHEPSGYIDEAYYDVRKISPDMLPV